MVYLDMLIFYIRPMNMPASEMSGGFVQGKQCGTVPLCAVLVPREYTKYSIIWHTALLTLDRAKFSSPLTRCRYPFNLADHDPGSEART